MEFKVELSTGRGRLGRLVTPHAEIPTPVFMPVGTQASVKSALPRDVWEAGFRIILANAYHLFLRPGAGVIREAGGLHSFMGWPGAILTDSGGYQVMSLGRLVAVDDGGASFRSHIDGAPVRFTAEDSVAIQVEMGADLIMCFDQCVPYPVSHEDAAEAAKRTVRWAERSRSVSVPEGQALFAIVQGSTYRALREECARALASLDFPGYALGGFSVGEPKTEMYDLVGFTASLCPEDRPRYLMGVGHPVDLVAAAMRGVDMFDCVLPTRNARHGRAFTFEGPLNLMNARYAGDFSPLEAGCDCHACTTFSRSYVRHLLVAGEALGRTLLTLHNLRFFHRLMERVREAMRQGHEEDLLTEMERLYPVGGK